MAADTTRRAWLRGIAPLAFGKVFPHSALAQGRGAALKLKHADYFSALMPLVKQGLLLGRGSLLLAPVDEQAIYFASDHGHIAETLWKPGSTVKPFLLEHLLERGLLRADEEFPCRGGAFPFAGRRLDCSHARQAAPLDPATALALSCNRCFLHWAERIDRTGNPTAFAEVLRLAGFSARQLFGQTTAASTVSLPRTREAMLLQALGEADVITSPLSMLLAYQGLCRRLRDRKGLTTVRGVASSVLLAGMRACIQAGTGIEANVKGLDLGGKTGTATSPGRRSLNGWMVSFWPSAAPRLLMVVCVEQGRGGAEAAPIAGEGWRAIERAGLLA